MMSDWLLFLKTSIILLLKHIPSLEVMKSSSLCRSVVSLAAAICALQQSHATAVSQEETSVESLANRIKHVIVLMLENRSFDHMLGFLKQQNKEIQGCLPNEPGCSNSFKPNDPSSRTVTVDDTAVYVQVSPHHSIDWTSEQVYGIPVGNTTSIYICKYIYIYIHDA